MKLFKRVVCISLAMTMSLGLVACGKDENGTSGNQNENKIAESKSSLADCTFRKDDGFSISGVLGEVNTYAASKDAVYIVTNEYAAATASDADAEYDGIKVDESVCRIYKAPIDGGQAEVVFESDKDDYEYIEKLTTAYDDSVYALKDNEGEYSLIKYDSEGETDLGDASALVDDADGAGMSDFVVDKDGNIVASFENSIKVFDSSLKEKCTCKCEDTIQNIGLDKDGNPLVATIAISEDYEVEKMNVRKIDTEAGTLAEEHEIDASSLSWYNQLMKGAGGYDFFFVTNANIYGYNFEGNKSTKVADFGVSGVNSSLVQKVVMIGDSTFIESEYNPETYETLPDLKKYNKVDPSEVKDKHIFTLATLYGGTDLAQAAIDYNNSQNENVVEIIDYSDVSDPAGKFSADLASGVKADFYDVTPNPRGISLRQYIAKGMLEDLTPYLEKDSELSSSDLVPTAYEAMLEDGKMYFVSSSALVETLAGKGSEIGKEPGWTYTEMKDYVTSKPEETRMFYLNNKMEILENFKGVVCADFVDWKAGECKFDSQDFKDLLVACNTGQNEATDWETYEPSMERDVPSGVQLFVSGTVGADDIAYYNQLFGGDVSYKGYPSFDKTCGKYYFQNAIAMSSECSDKEAAWKFLRYFLTEEYQGQYYDSMYGMPTRNDVFEVYMDQFTFTKDGKDKYGNEIKARNSEFEIDGLQYKFKPLTKDELDTFRHLIENTKGRLEPDGKIWDIVEEEAAAYFSGDKSVDDVCKVIQDRVTTYVNESK